MEKVSQSVDKRVDEINLSIDTLKENVKAEVATIVEKIDKNEDGKVDVSEAASHLEKDGNWKSVESWVQILVALLCGWLGIKFTKPAVASLHKVGREELAKRSDTKE